MHASAPLESASLLTRHRYDEERLVVVAEVGAATADDLRVLASSRLVHVVIEDDYGTTTRSLRPPSREHRFTDDRRAVLNNGVLEVTVGVDRHGPRRERTRR